jgi:TetR/AcrR family transcriptional repressor of nem operon
VSSSGGRLVEQQRQRPRDLIAQFAAMADARAAIETFLGDIVERSLADPLRRGCLLVNTALEVAPHEPAIGARVSGWLGEVEVPSLSQP